MKCIWTLSRQPRQVDLGNVKYWLFKTYKLTLCSVGGIGWSCPCLCFYRVPCYNDPLSCCCTAPELNEGYTLLQNQSCARVHSAQHTAGFRRMEQSTLASCLTLISLCRIVAVRIIWGCDRCFRFMYTSHHLLLSVHILAELHKCWPLRHLPDLGYKLWIPKKCLNQIRKVNAE